MVSGKKKILINVISSGGQVAIIGLIYFFLYRFLLEQLNIKLLGVWSIVLATSSLANLANFGVTTSVVRFMALYQADNEVEKMNRLIFTASGFLLLLFLGLSIIIYPFANFFLKYVIEEKYISQALNILPYSISCLILNSIAGTYASVMDGLQKNFARSIIFTTSAGLLLLLTYLLTPAMGLKGVAIAQLIQSIYILVFTLLFVMKVVRYNPIKWQWDKGIFREIFSYGIKFQFISLSTMLNEPVTKAFLAKFGGLAFAGYYEMANRLVMQVRGVIVNANQSLVSVVAGLDKKDDKQNIISLYKNTFVSVFAVSMLFMSLLCIMATIISRIWIGFEEPIFINIVFILCGCLFLSLLSGPSFFNGIASGNLKNLILSQILIGGSNVLLGYLLGKFMNGYGVVMAWCISVILGSLFLIYSYHKKNGLKVFSMLDKPLVIISILSITGICCTIFLRFKNKNNHYYLPELICFSIVLFLFAKYFYSLFRQLKIGTAGNTLNLE